MRILIGLLLMLSLASCRNTKIEGSSGSSVIANLPTDTQTRKSVVLGEGYISCQLAEDNQDNSSKADKESKFILSFSNAVEKGEMGGSLDFDIQKYLFLEVDGGTYPCLFYHAEPSLGNGFNRKAIVDFGYKLAPNSTYNIVLKGNTTTQDLSFKFS